MIASKRQSLGKWAQTEDDRIDVAEAALELAALERPDTPLAPYRAHLAEIGQMMVEQAGGRQLPLGERLGILVRVLVDRFDYRGEADSADDLADADLIRVIERRRGLPVALGVLYLHAARAAGWTMTGLNFPGRFLVRLETESGVRAILDPFSCGEAVTPRRLRRLLKEAMGPLAELAPANYQPMTNREVLLRLHNNVKVRLLRAGRLESALAAVEAMLALAPDAPELWREIGLIQSRIGNLCAAVTALERYMTLAPECPSRHRAGELLRELYGRLL